MSNEKTTGGLFGAPTITPVAPAVPESPRLPTNVNLTPRERDLIIEGLQTRMCFIETGTVGLRAADVEAWGDDRPAGATARIKALSLDQMRIILDSEAIIASLRK